MRYIFLILILANFCYSQDFTDRNVAGRKYAEEQLAYVLKNKNLQTINDNNKIILKDSLSAIKYAESMLISIYGEKKIITWKPYEVYHVNNYWILFGNLPKGHKGGTLECIMDDRDARVIFITAGK